MAFKLRYNGMPDGEMTHDTLAVLFREAAQRYDTCAEMLDCYVEQEILKEGIVILDDAALRSLWLDNRETEDRRVEPPCADPRS